MKNTNKTILSLYDYTGEWSQPYRNHEYNVIQIDIKLDGTDVRLLENPGKVHGIIAQPPCTHFTLSGARWWKQKGEEAVLEGLQLVDAALRFVATCEPEWWVLENPVGRLPNWLGDYKMAYHPHEYAGWADVPAKEAYTKRTCLWGNFETPVKKDVGNILGSKMHMVPGSNKQSERRAKTPQGFSRAFFDVNR